MKNKLTPMMQQYMEIKENTKDALVFFRLGDFYELFFEDAEIAAKVLDLVLTSRSAGNNIKAPMAGVPHHAAKAYIEKLIDHGYKVAIVEQVEDPKEAKGIVKREVVEILSPGTYFEKEDDIGREIASIELDLVYASIVTGNVISGNLRAIRVMNEKHEIIKQLQQFQVKEIVISNKLSLDLIEDIRKNAKIHITFHDEIDHSYQDEDISISKAYGRLMDYLNKTQNSNLLKKSTLIKLNEQSYCRMDYNTMKNLELLEHDKDSRLSLFSFLNQCKTSMGSRLMREIIMRPLYSEKEIIQRQEQIEILMTDFLLREQVEKHLEDIYDIQRIMARIETEKHSPQDFVRLEKSLDSFKKLQEELIIYPNYDFLQTIDNLNDLQNILENSFLEDAPVSFKDGRTFKEGVNEELDELMRINSDGKSWLLNYEQQEREKTGIKNLKVGYTRAFGYYIEISKGQISNVKDEFNYIRRQTLTNSERYISEKLQQFEDKISQASERIQELELRLFKKYTKLVLKYLEQIHIIASAISYIDVLYALSLVSMNPNYTKPKFSSDNKYLNITNGRHPILEKTLKNQEYIASDVNFDENTNSLILTGPNMGGKSTYMRMLAVNVILAQIGSYVPCEDMELSLVDQIFTRMGASDDILMGQSTFMVEMLESQEALHHASEKSLVLFDEIGRGTSTYDGMALARAIIEYMSSYIACRTIFSTHYHELTNLAFEYSNIKNIHVTVHEENEKVTFLYKIEEGQAERSYGINVARLAQLPEAVIKSAKEHLELLESSRINQEHSHNIKVIEKTPRELDQIEHKLNSIDINQLTPIEALVLLSDLQKIMKGEIDG